MKNNIFTLFDLENSPEIMHCGMWVKFASMLGMNVDKYKTAEHFEGDIVQQMGIWIKVQEGLNQRLEVEDTRRHTVNEISNSKN